MRESIPYQRVLRACMQRLRVAQPAGASPCIKHALCGGATGYVEVSGHSGRANIGRRFAHVR